MQTLIGAFVRTLQNTEIKASCEYYTPLFFLVLLAGIRDCIVRVTAFFGYLPLFAINQSTNQKPKKFGIQDVFSDWVVPNYAGCV